MLPVKFKFVEHPDKSVRFLEYTAILKFHYIKYGSTLSNRNEFSNVFPFILLTTTLVIAIVKSSLALSLGLVGALSIVRFRNPVKSPLELTALFAAISYGVMATHSIYWPLLISVTLSGVILFIHFI